MLTDEQITEIALSVGMVMSHDGQYMRSLGTHGGMNAEDGRAFARAIESAVLAAAEGPAPAPVAVVDDGDDGLFVEILYGPDGSSLKCGDKLYAAPPQGPAPVAEGREAMETALLSLDAMVEMCKTLPQLQGRGYISLGIQANNAITALRAALSTPPAQAKPWRDTWLAKSFEKFLREEKGWTDEAKIAAAVEAIGRLTFAAPSLPVQAQADALDAARLPGNVKPDTDKQVFFYEQDFYVLSNFSAFSLQWFGLRFDTSEAAYHWEKFMGTSADDIRAQIRLAPSAHEALKIAERNKIYRRPDWDEVKVDLMREILRAKADQHEYVRRKLLATGDRELIEDSWRDDFWGWGPNRDGRNMLGKLWMEVRAELRAAIQAEKARATPEVPK